MFIVFNNSIGHRTRLAHWLRAGLSPISRSRAIHGANISGLHRFTDTQTC